MTKKTDLPPGTWFWVDRGPYACELRRVRPKGFSADVLGFVRSKTVAETIVKACNALTEPKEESSYDAKYIHDRVRG
jgi:hypothetical protein